MVKITKFIFFSTSIAWRFTYEKPILRLQFANHFGSVSRKQSITDSNFRPECRKWARDEKLMYYSAAGFMPRKPLDQWVGGAVDFFVRQAGGEAVPLPAPVHIRAAGGRPQADRGINPRGNFCTKIQYQYGCVIYAVSRKLSFRHENFWLFQDENFAPSFRNDSPASYRRDNRLTPFWD